MVININSMLNKNDGEDMSITGGKNSLLSYIRLAELNPYALGDNPYKELAKDFLLYNSAYPISYNRQVNYLEMAKGSIGVNVRIYKISRGALRCKSINKFINFEEFDLWREIRYYEYVRENIIKRKVSPNFVNMILYKTDTESNIDWDKLTNLIYKDSPQDVLKHINSYAKSINDKHNLKHGTTLLEKFRRGKATAKDVYKSWLDKYRESSRKSIDINNFMFRIVGDDKIEVLRLNKNRSQLYKYNPTTKELDIPVSETTYANQKDEWEKCNNLEDCLKKADLSADSGKSLVVLTEAPTQNIISWASTIYQQNGVIKTMVQTGYHSVDQWKSVLFQLTYLCAVLQKHQIYFNRMSLENNIFVRDMVSDVESPRSWIYKVNGINFYVPNNGQLVLFDSKFCDVRKVGPSVVVPVTKEKRTFKTNMEIFKENGDVNKVDISNYVLKAFKKIVDPSQYSNGNNGINKPHDDVMELLRKLHNMTHTNIEECLIDCFPEYTHINIGKLLTVAEKEDLNLMIAPKLRTGGLIVLRERYEEYRWAVYLNNVDNLRHRILKRNNDGNIVTDEIFSHSIIHYPDVESQELNTNKLIEIYNFDN